MIHPRLAPVAALLVAVSMSLMARDAVAQFPSNQAAAFTGAWCAQGDPTKHASISSNGAFLTLTNENGNTSPGQLQGQTGIVAPGWEFVTGTLNPDGSQINWSNGSFWARCNSGGGGGQHCKGQCRGLAQALRRRGIDPRAGCGLITQSG